MMENEKNIVAPENKEWIELSQTNKDFVLLYVQLNSLSAVKNHLEISVEEAIDIYKDPKVQDGIKYCKNLRLLNIYKRKMLSLEQLGSILSNQITDYDLPLDSHLSPKEKIEASKLLIDVHKTINSSTLDPSNIEAYDLTFDPKDLDAEQIKALLTKIEPSKKREVPQENDEDPLIEKMMYLENNQIIEERRKSFENSKIKILSRLNSLKEIKNI